MLEADAGGELGRKRKKEKKKNDECFFDFMCVGNGNWNLCSPKGKS